MPYLTDKDLKAMMPFINTPLWPIFERYLKQRIEILKDDLISAGDMKAVIDTQGRILELKDLLGLRETIESVKSMSE